MSSINITVAEQKLLAAVLRQIPDLPAVDYQQVANEVGTKYGKNARTAFKKLWEKIKGAANVADNPAGEDGGPTKKRTKVAATTVGGDGGEPPKKKAKVMKKGTARPVAKPGRKKSIKKEQALIAHADPDETEVEDEAQDYSQTSVDEYEGMTPGAMYQAMGVRTPPGRFSPA